MTDFKLLDQLLRNRLTTDKYIPGTYRALAREQKVSPLDLGLAASEQDYLISDIPPLDIGPALVSLSQLTLDGQWTAVLEKAQPSQSWYHDHIDSSPNYRIHPSQYEEAGNGNISPLWGLTSVYIEGTPAGSPTSLQPLIPRSEADSSQYSFNSFIQYIDSEAQRSEEQGSPALGIEDNEIFSSTRDGSDDLYEGEEAIIEEATIAVQYRAPLRPMRLTIPPRGSSLKHRTILNSSLARRARRSRPRSPEVNDFDHVSENVRQRQKSRRHKIWAKMKAKLRRGD